MKINTAIAKIAKKLFQQIVNFFCVCANSKLFLCIDFKFICASIPAVTSSSPYVCYIFTAIKIHASLKLSKTQNLVKKHGSSIYFFSLKHNKSKKPHQAIVSEVLSWKKTGDNTYAEIV